MADEAEEAGNDVEPTVDDTLAVLLGTPSDIDVADLTAVRKGEGRGQATFAITQELDIV